MWLKNSLIGWRQQGKASRDLVKVKAKRQLVDRGIMAKVKKRVHALSRWTNQLWKVTLCWCISKWLETMIWTHMVKWFKSQGLICVCFIRWDKDVCDPYEATPWRNHTWDTNYSRSLLNYVLFNLSIGIVVLSRGIQKEGWCLPKLKPPNSKAILKTEIPWTLCVWLLLGLRNRVFVLKKQLSFFSWVELLQLSWAFLAELNFFSWVEFFQLSWTSTSTVKLSDQKPVELASRPVELGFIS
jgi:hypothetical protein